MRDLKSEVSDQLSAAMGERLVGQRAAIGYETSHEAWSKMVSMGVEVSYFRYRRLEDGDLPRTQAELIGVSSFLDIDIGCWLEGICNIDKEIVAPDIKILLNGMHQYGIELAKDLGL